MQPLEIKKDIYWIGAVDFESRDFHGYSLSPQGTTYNAYLVKDEKNVIFDTVKAEFSETLLCRLAHIIEPEKVDYIVINHVELDHAGALPELIKACRPEKIFCSPMGLKALEGHFDISGWPIEVKRTGDTLNIGRRTIHFIETRMLHWPDSMFSYIPEDKLLISNDAFGQNIASSARFADQVERGSYEHAVREYYHNIILPYSQQVLKLLEQVETMQLEIDMIAPDHGLILRGEYVPQILAEYKKFALQKMQKQALIIYDTMWNSTQKMAYSIAEGLISLDIPTRVMYLKQNHHSAVMTAFSHCGLLVAGSPTHNNGILPHVAQTLTFIKGLRPLNRIGAAFGSFGWSGECVNIIGDYLTQMGMEQPVPAYKHKYVPNHVNLRECYNMGRSLGEALIDRCSAF